MKKKALVKFSVEKQEGRVPVLLNIAEGSTREAVAQAAAGREMGRKAD